jgi:hypothetical protein
LCNDLLQANMLLMKEINETQQQVTSLKKSGFTQPGPKRAIA